MRFLQNGKFCIFESNIFMMDLQTRKNEFIQEFLKLQSEELIAQFESLLKNKSIPEKPSVKPMSIKKLNSRIDASEVDFENGKFKTTEQLLAKYK